MNLGGHVLVAAALGADPLVRLGSALPDVATIGGFRLVPHAGDGPIAEGVALHHATDGAFHAHAWFTEQMAGIAAALRADGVSRGARRAAAHVGTELLLDGALFDRRDDRQELVTEALRTVEGPSVSRLLEGFVPASRRDAWAAHIARLPGWSSPGWFRDPTRVAERIARLVADRPRLVVADDEIALIAAALAGALADIDATAEGFLSDLVAEVADRRAEARRGPSITGRSG